MTARSPTERIQRGYAEMEAMPPELRACVNEFGIEIVRCCLRYGVDKPNQIRDLVREIWAGARQPMQGRTFSKTHTALNKVDWVLIQAGAQVSAPKLIRVMADNGIFVIPSSALPTMVQASMTAIHGMGILTKEKKHTIRLQAAIAAGRKAVLHEIEEDAAA